MGWLNYDKYGMSVGGESLMDQIPHYYGDHVRALFVAASALWLVSLPFFPSILPFDPVLQVISIVIVVVFAALTNPRKIWILTYDTLIAGMGVVIFEVTAIYYFSVSTWIEFFVREALVILFLLALYMSIKTLRAMYMHQIGKKSDFDRQ